MTTVSPAGPGRASSDDTAAAKAVSPVASRRDRWSKRAGTAPRPAKRGATRCSGNVCTLTGSRRVRATKPRAAATRWAISSLPPTAIDADVSTNNRRWRSSSASYSLSRRTSRRA